MLKKLSKYIYELVCHKKISHSLNDVMMAANREHHVVHSLLEDRIYNADSEETNYIDISHDEQQRIVREHETNLVNY